MEDEPTRPGRKLPCPPAASRCTYKNLVFAIECIWALWPRYCAPAGDLERGAKDLGSHEFRHFVRGFKVQAKLMKLKVDQKAKSDREGKGALVGW